METEMDEGPGAGLAADSAPWTVPDMGGGTTNLDLREARSLVRALGRAQAVTDDRGLAPIHPAAGWLPGPAHALADRLLAMLTEDDGIRAAGTAREVQLGLGALLGRVSSESDAKSPADYAAHADGSFDEWYGALRGPQHRWQIVLPVGHRVRAQGPVRLEVGHVVLWRWRPEGADLRGADWDVALAPPDGPDRGCMARTVVRAGPRTAFEVAAARAAAAIGVLHLIVPRVRWLGPGSPAATWPYVPSAWGDDVPDGGSPPELYPPGTLGMEHLTCLDTRGPEMSQDDEFATDEGFDEWVTRSARVPRLPLDPAIAALVAADETFARCHQLLLAPAPTPLGARLIACLARLSISYELDCERALPEHRAIVLGLLGPGGGGINGAARRLAHGTDTPAAVLREDLAWMGTLAARPWLAPGPGELAMRSGRARWMAERALLLLLPWWGVEGTLDEVLLAFDRARR